MEGRVEAHDPYDVASPRYGPALRRMPWSVVPGVVTLLAVLVADLAWVWRAVAVAAVIAAATLAVNARFASCWLSSQRRRVRLYPGLLKEKRELERELATLHGMRILAARLAPLDVEGLYEQDGRVVIVAARRDADAIQRGETLLVVDTLERKLVGRARVVALEPGRCEAEVHEPLAALFWGFIRQEVASYRRQPPPDVAVFREANVLAKEEAFARLMEEAEQ